ncbi:hypothetical protein HNV06_25370 [Oceanispirochaeta sp. M1]|nr:hypothetical protein [Oceanispirochaeta sp. M1]RDG28704.1 hypothetical protein DV872_25505 [Oceanispirochaeta sp. M1]
MRAKDSELDEIYNALIAINESSCDPPLEKPEVERAAYGACSYKKGPNGEYTATIFKKAENVDLVIRGNIFEYFRAHEDKTYFFNYTMLYMALVQITSLNNGEKIYNYTNFINKNYQLSPKFIPKGIRYFENLGILKVTERDSDGTYKHRDIEFMPNRFNGGKK